MLIVVDYEKQMDPSPHGNVILIVDHLVTPGEFYLNVIVGWQEEGNDPPTFEAHQGSGPHREEWSVGTADHVFRFGPLLYEALPSSLYPESLNWEYSFTAEDVLGLVRFTRTQYEGEAPGWSGEVEVRPMTWPNSSTTTVRFQLGPEFEAAYSPPEPRPAPVSAWHRLLED